MKKATILFFFLSFVTNLFAQNEINWLTIEQAIELQEHQPKKMLVYVYTDWCTVCKSLESDLFKDTNFTQKANKDFYPVKFNAERKESFQFNNKTYDFIGDDIEGKHEFAYEAMEEFMAFPGMAFYSEDLYKINVIRGKQPQSLLVTYLDYISTNAYKAKEWFEYSNQKSK